MARRGVSVAAASAVVALLSSAVGGADAPPGTPDSAAVAKNKPSVVCWKGFPGRFGGTPKLKSAPNRCSFFRRGGEFGYEGVDMKSINWKHWGAPHARGVGEGCMGSCAPVTVILSKLRNKGACDERIYSKARFEIPGPDPPDSDFLLYTTC